MSLEPDLEVPRGVPAVRHRVVKVRDHVASECQDHLAVEEPLEIRLGGISLSVTMRSPGEDEELVAGFLFSEGIIAGADDLDVLARYRGPDGDPDEGNVMNVLREDIGRHNAVDKVIGYMVLARGVPLDRHVLMVSGRVSFEIMQKALTARIPVIAAVSAPSSMAVQMALAADMTLIGFMRNGGFNLYAGAHRLAPSVAELV